MYYRNLLQCRAAMVTKTSESEGESVQSVAESIEANLRVLGCSGVEDRLQENVAEVIEELRTCNVKIWMLTGDKPETVSYHASGIQSEKQSYGVL